MKLVVAPSSNYEPRQDKIQFIVLHATDTDDVEKTFERLIDSVEPNRVSAHYLIDKLGLVYAMVPEDQTAWHAGASDWNGYCARSGKNGLNHASIGIELQCEGNGNGTILGNFSTEQLAACDELVTRLMKRYDILPENIVRHSDIAPNRKKDPGPNFPWEEMKRKWQGQ